MSNPHDAGRAAYQADLRAHPCYPDGKPRPSWPQLGTILRGEWTRKASRPTHTA